MKRFLLGTAAILVTACGWTTAAHAQSDTSVLVETAIPDNFDRDRNVSVLERPRPDYDPLGIRYRTFLITPQVELGGGATDNVYLLPDDKKGDAFAYLAPSVQAQSDWAKDQVLLSANGLFRRYFSQARRNETSYNLRAMGEKDIGPYLSFTGEGQYAKLYESPDTGAIDSALAVLSSYQRSYLSGRGQYRAGRGRAIIAIDRTAFTFSNIVTGTGDINQSDRDRVVSRITGEYQYALSPSVSLYGQGSYNDTNYSRRLLSGAENRDSTGWRAIGGVNFDLAGLMRGKVGIGYIQRDYNSPAFKDAHGFSAEALVEFFPSQLTTVTLGLSRTLQDSSVNSSGAYFEDLIQGRVDHEVLNNLIVGASAEYRRQSYIDVTARNNYYRAAANARYLSSRFVALNGTISYLRRGSDGAFSGPFSEWRGQIGITLRR